MLRRQAENEHNLRKQHCKEEMELLGRLFQLAQEAKLQDLQSKHDA